MTDPLAEVVTLLQPRAAFSKLSTAAGSWRVSRQQSKKPFYLVVLDGACRIAVNGQPPITLSQGDFVLIPSALHGSTTSLVPPPPGQPDDMPTEVAPGEFRIGPPGAPDQVQMLVGHCRFGSPDAALLVSLLPALVLVQGQTRLTTLMHLIRDEFLSTRPAREVILSRLLEVLMIEALRGATGTGTAPGLVRGLADDRLAAAIRSMHADPGRAWTVALLAKTAALSRSAFFARFSKAVGVAPMEYLLAWRMALGKNLLLRDDGNVAKVARAVGYGSASAFSTAFTRHVGIPPGRYATASLGAAE